MSGRLIRSDNHAFALFFVNLTFMAEICRRLDMLANLALGGPVTRPGPRRSIRDYRRAITGGFRRSRPRPCNFRVRDAKHVDTVGEITIRRQAQPILCILVEFVRAEILFSSSLAP